jgi:hypothetical protein
VRIRRQVGRTPGYAIRRESNRRWRAIRKRSNARIVASRLRPVLLEAETAIICERQTEEGFVKECLAPHLVEYSVYVTPRLLGKTPTREGGGNVSVNRVVSYIRRVHRNFDHVTTFLDFYGFNDKGEMSCSALTDDIAKRAERALGTGYSEDHIIPYVQRHEFETLLFSRPDAFDLEEAWTDEQPQELESIRIGFATPDDINDDPRTAPSKRLARTFSSGAFPKYDMPSQLLGERGSIITSRSQETAEPPTQRGWEIMMLEKMVHWDARCRPYPD